LIFIRHYYFLLLALILFFNPHSAQATVSSCGINHITKQCYHEAEIENVWYSGYGWNWQGDRCGFEFEVKCSKLKYPITEYQYLIETSISVFLLGMLFLIYLVWRAKARKT